MSTPISIFVGNERLDGILFDTPTAKAIAKMLPIESRFNVWGDEFYFSIPLYLPLDDTATKEVRIGDIGYWPDGYAIAIFFGPTPMSTGSNPVPVSKVNLVGEIIGDATILRNVKTEKEIRIKKRQ